MSNKDSHFNNPNYYYNNNTDDCTITLMNKKEETQLKDKIYYICDKILPNQWILKAIDKINNNDNNHYPKSAKNVNIFGTEYTVNHSAKQQLNHMSEISRGLYTLGIAVAAQNSSKNIVNEKSDENDDENVVINHTHMADKNSAANIMEALYYNFLNEKEVASHHIQKNCIIEIPDNNYYWRKYSRNYLNDHRNKHIKSRFDIIADNACIIINESEYILHQLCKFALIKDDQFPKENNILPKIYINYIEEAAELNKWTNDDISLKVRDDSSVYRLIINYSVNPIIMHLLDKWDGDFIQMLNIFTLDILHDEYYPNNHWVELTLSTSAIHPTTLLYFGKPKKTYKYMNNYNHNHNNYHNNHNQNHYIHYNHNSNYSNHSHHSLNSHHSHNNSNQDNNYPNTTYNTHEHNNMQNQNNNENIQKNHTYSNHDSNINNMHNHDINNHSHNNIDINNHNTHHNTNNMHSHNMYNHNSHHNTNNHNINNLQNNKSNNRQNSGNLNSNLNYKLIYELSSKSSIIPELTKYNIVIKHDITNRTPCLTLSAIDEYFNKNIYIDPSIYAIIYIPHGKRVSKVKITNKGESKRIIIWEAFIDASKPMRLVSTGQTNCVIKLCNNLIGQDCLCSDCPKEIGNYMIIEIPYVNPKTLCIIGGEVAFSNDVNKYKKLVEQIPTYNIPGKDLLKNEIDISTIPSLIKSRFANPYPSLSFNNNLSFPVFKNSFIPSSFILKINNSNLIEE